MVEKLLGQEPRLEIDDETSDSESDEEVAYWGWLEEERDEQEFLAGYYEAQTRLKMSYLCKEMVRPCRTPLDDRIVAPAHLGDKAL